MFRIHGTTTYDDVERITLGTRILGLVPMPVHCYRIGSTLIDAGPPKSTNDLLDTIDPDAITTVLLTHHHEDHVGAAATLRDHGATVYAPQDAIDWLADPTRIHTYRQRAWGSPDPVNANPLPETIQTPDATFHVHPVPGHSPDHVAFLEDEHGWLFAGDAFLPPRDTLRADEDLEGFLSSLETMRTLDASRIFPGHGSIAKTPQQALTTVLDHFHDLRDQAHQLQANGLDATTIRRRLLGWEGFIRYYTGGHYAKQNLVDELLTLESPHADRER